MSWCVCCLADELDACVLVCLLSYRQGQKVMGIQKYAPCPFSLCLCYMSRSSVMNLPIGEIGACPGAMRPDLLGCPWQGLVDYALAPAGGRVISHSQLYPRPDDPAITTWSQIGAALVPGGVPAVHPKADKVALPACFTRPSFTCSAACICHVDTACACTPCLQDLTCSIRERPHWILPSKPHMPRACA